MNQPKHVLDGYKVLDFSQIVAGPTCTLMLAEMGAEVIKVELAPAGDGARLGPVLIDGRSGYFVQHNRGKKDLCLNAKTPEGLKMCPADKSESDDGDGMIHLRGSWMKFFE